MPKVLVVDDELSIRESFSLILEDKYEVRQAASGEAALKISSDQKVDLVYLDIRMPGMDGLETLKMLKKIDPNLEIIMVTAVNDVQKASQAVKLGARDYVVKPFDVNNVLKLTEQILRRKAILSEGTEIQKKTGKRAPELMGQSEKIMAVLKTISRIKEDERVLICGETGTEKEEAARLIHEKSQRADFPFRTLDLSSQMSSIEIQSLLFGREKGTNITELEAKAGLLEELKDGTLFINNLESLPPEIFKTISNLQFSRLGLGSSPAEGEKIPLQSRLIAGTNHDLSQGSPDLLEFFSGVRVELPALRERSSDIPILANHLLEKFNQEFGLDVKISPAALEALTSYPWPGNFQELASLIQRLVLAVSGPHITLEDLPLDILIRTTEGAGSSFLETFEHEYIQSIFDKRGKNKEKTAEHLGINPVLLETKL